ncbi:MAG: PKD domain-containing protein, partial [Bacteroidia bacterium]
WMNFEAENNWDAMVLERSLNKGVSWQKVDANNYQLDYNSTSTLGPIDGPKWSGSSSGWQEFKVIDSMAANESSVNYRFVFGSDGSGVDEGFAIDDITIDNVPTKDLGISAIIDPQSGCGTSNTTLSVIITNYGVANQDSIPVSAVITGDILGTTLIDTFFNTIAVGGSDTLTFSTSLNTIKGGELNITASTNFVGDQIANNNSTSTSVTLGATPSAPITFNTQRCGAGQVALIAASNQGEVVWYDSLTGGKALSTGDTLLVNLSSTTTYYAQVSDAPVFPVRITEVDLGNPDFIEIQNLSSNTFNANGYQVITSDSYTDIDDVNSDAWNLGTLNGLEVQFKTDLSTTNYWGSNLFYNSASPGWVMIIDSANSEVVDYMAWGWTASEIANQAVAFRGNTYSPGTQWSGAGINSTCTNTLNRIGSSDNNTSADWTCTTASRGSMNSGLGTLSGCPSQRTAATATILPKALGMGVIKGSVFSGKSGNGTVSGPDTVCVTDTVTYEITPPTGYSNSDFGTKWLISAVTAADFQNNSPANTSIVQPTSTSNGYFQLVATGSDIGRVFEVSMIANIVGSTCDTTITRFIYVNPNPQVSFSAADICEKDLTSFTNNTSIAGGLGMIYDWDFGDNSTSVAPSPSHRYNKAGTYTVQLTATTTGGCAATAAGTIDVFDLPIAKLGVVDACNGNDVMFTDSSSVANGSIDKYSWNFGDSTLSSRKNTTHTYSGVGAYNVSLTVITNNGCEATTTGQAQVFAVPTASFSAANACVSDSVSFSNNTQYTGNATLNYTWNYNDGNVSTAASPKHLFSSNGAYFTKLNVTSTDGCSDSVSQLVIIYADPVADFDYDLQCYGDSTAFINMSTINGGTISGYEWSFENNSSTDLNIKNVFDQAGIYDVTLNAMSTDGCSNTVTQSIEIFSTPTASFSVVDTCAGQNLRLLNNSTSASDTVTFVWTFSDNDISTDFEPTKSFENSGIYSIDLNAVTNNGCTNSFSNQVEIFGLPDATFEFGHMGKGRYNFTANDENLVSYFWDFGDGETSDEATIEYKYDAEGQYDVSLTTINSNGCQSTSLVGIDVSTSLAELNGTNGMSIFPNPYTESTNIAYKLKQSANVSLAIYDMHGKLIKQFVAQEQHQGDYNYQFSGNNPSGIYLVKFTVNEKVEISRLVKTN